MKGDGQSPNRGLSFFIFYYAAVNWRWTKCGEITFLNFVIQLSSSSASLLSFFCSLQSFFSSSPPIVVIKLVGFCGFEVEQGETQVYLCFLTGSLHRERELKWVDCTRGAGDTGERSHWLKVTFAHRCDKTANLLHMQPGELAMSSHCFHLHVHETTGARKWHWGGIQCVRFKSFGCAALRRARIMNLCVCMGGGGAGVCSLHYISRSVI